MTTFKEKIIKLIHKIYREDEFINSFIGAISTQFDKIDNTLSKLSSLFYFDRLDNDGCKWWEDHLDISQIPNELDDRRSQIKAKWRSNGHNEIKLVENVCNSWRNGEVDVDFVNGKLKLTFNGAYGVPSDINSLIAAIGEVKPAFIGLLLIYKYLLIEDIHEVKTIAEMEEITLDMFAFGGIPR